MTKLTQAQAAALAGVKLRTVDAPGDKLMVQVRDERGNWVDLAQGLGSAQAAATVRRVVNGQQFGNVSWDFLTREDDAAIADELARRA